MARLGWRLVRGSALAAPLLLLLSAATGRTQSGDPATYALFGNEKVALGRDGVVLAGNVGTNGKLIVGSRSVIGSGSDVAGDVVRLGSQVTIAGALFFNFVSLHGATVGTLVHPLLLPILTLPPPPAVSPGVAGDITVDPGVTISLLSGSYGNVRVRPGGTLLFAGDVDLQQLLVQSGKGATTTVRCDVPLPCTVRVAARFALGGSGVGVTGSPLVFEFAGARSAVVGGLGADIRATVRAPLATLKLKSSTRGPATFTGQFLARKVKVGAAAVVSLGEPPPCGNGTLDPGEQCDPPADAACPGTCRADCFCPAPPGTEAILHAVGPTVLHNATAFGIQLFGEHFLDGATVALYDKGSGTLLASVPGNVVSSTEMTALVPAGLAVPAGIQRELTARVVNPGSGPSNTPDIGSCATDLPTSPTACTSDADCPAGAGVCQTGKQRLTLFNDLVFLNPNSAAVVPAPHGLCDDGTRCQGAAECTGVGSGACSPKLYVTPQQRDELWVFNTGTRAFVSPAPGQTGIPVGDNPFHVEILDRGGGVSRAWVVNRFDDSLSIIDPATDTELVRLTGAALGVPGRLRMETEIEFNRAGTRAYLSNENLDEVQVLDIGGARLDAPVLVATIDVGVNPRGMATDATDTRLYVANIQSADVSVVDIAPGSPTENQVLRTIAARPTDDIVGGRADGWEDFVISGRAPRGIVFSDAQNAVFLTSIGPQTGPRQGVVQTGGAIINPTITVIDAATDTIVAHVALDVMNPNRFSCTDPELMALDDARGRLYVTCQGSGTVDVLDTAALAAGLPAEVAIASLPLPSDVTVPTLSLPSATGGYGQKVCGAFTTNRGAACTTDADCSGCPTLVEGLPVTCCAVNNPVGLHNGPRGIALSADRDTLFVVNQFTTSVAVLDVSSATPVVVGTTSFPGAFGTNIEQRERRLGQIEFFTDVKNTGISCATCHIDDHQDGVFFEADVRGPRLRRVLSVRGTRDFPPLLQDQLVPDLTSFTDIVVHAERGGAVPCIPCLEVNGAFTCFGTASSECFMTSNTENRQNALYAKAITFFPNPNLAPDGAFSTAVPLPGGVTGDAVRGAEVFDQLACLGCHPEPLFTIDQLRSFDTSTLGQPLRMRDVSTPVLLPLRERCQDATRPTGFDGSTGFTVPTLRGIWDTFPLLVSGAAGLGVVGPEPAFAPGCTPGSSGCCAQLRSPLNPAGIVVPAQHLALTTKDALRAVLTPPLAVPGTGHGTALGLTSDDLNALIAYLRSL
jgi:DNA-binding beta-propeller fold protein YncE